MLLYYTPNHNTSSGNIISVCVSKQSSLLRWTKGFNASGVVGEDIVQLLQDAVHRLNAKGVKCEVDVVAVINDTVGTLMSCAYDDHNCSIGMVVGEDIQYCGNDYSTGRLFNPEILRYPEGLKHNRTREITWTVSSKHSTA